MTWDDAPADVAHDGAPRFEWERAVRDHPDVHGRRQELLLLVATHWNRRTGLVAVTQATLAEQMNINERNLRPWLTWALKAGWLVRHSVGRQGRASEYVLAFPLPDVQASDYSDVQPDVQASDYSAGNRMLGGVQPDVDEPQADVGAPLAGCSDIRPSSGTSCNSSKKTSWRDVASELVADATQRAIS